MPVGIFVYYEVRMPKLQTEYEGAAAWCSTRGLNGMLGDPLPEGLSVSSFNKINADLSAFQRLVAEMA